MILLNAVRKISEEFPILKEAKREVLNDLMDIDSAISVLKQKEIGRIKVTEIDTRLPSPFAFDLLAHGYSDIYKMEDRMDFLRRMHQLVLAKIALEQGRSSRR